MGRHRDGSVSERDELEEDRKSKSRARGNDDVDSPDAGDRKSDGKHRRKRLAEDSSDSDSGKERKRRRSRKHSGKRESRKRRSDESDSEYSDSEESESSESLTEESESEEERKRRKRREKRKRKEREEEKERKRRRKGKRSGRRRKQKLGREVLLLIYGGSMGLSEKPICGNLLYRSNKRPEFSAWLSEVKQVNLETLPNWEEKQMFKQYYDLDAYYKRQMLKELKSGKKVQETERTMFNDEELKRQEQMREREKQKEKEVEALKLSMQSGMAQAMKDQALLREEMAYQYKIGNYEAAAAIQRKLEPDPI
ncbi:unnamed protein product [Linum tenue]|uniref:Nucleic acid binding protein n=1 Tax=Linum tenue TaxID=586396 RepID=A0AAV0GRQ6_9ROSI|nr:unnamed protein product [Linum tenue]